MSRHVRLAVRVCQLSVWCGARVSAEWSPHGWCGVCDVGVVVVVVSDMVFNGDYQSPYSSATNPGTQYMSLMPKGLTLLLLVALAYKLHHYYVVTCCVNFTVFPGMLTPLFLVLYNPLLESVFSVSVGQPIYGLIVTVFLVSVSSFVLAGCSVFSFLIAACVCVCGVRGHVCSSRCWRRRSELLRRSRVSTMHCTACGFRRARV